MATASITIAETSVENLLPELLLALLGHTGGAFITQNDIDGDDVPTCSPRLSDSVDWVTESEREQLNRLVSLGYFFSHLETFVDKSTDYTSIPRVYQNALANGVAELLDVYRSAILEVEQRLLRQPSPPLLSIQHFLGDFEILLPEVTSIVNQASSQELNGGHIMHILHKRSRCGIPSIQSCASRLLWHCTQVMFKQLESWLIHGTVIDPGSEFFIQNMQQQQTHSAHSTKKKTSDASANHSFTSLDGIIIKRDALPPGITYATASKILFIGKAIQILRSSNSMPTNTTNTNNTLNNNTINNNTINTRTTSSSSSSPIDIDVAEFSQMLWDLGRKEELFRPASLEYGIDIMRTKVAASLWTITRHHSDLLGQLSAMHTFYLLGRGDMYQRLFEEGRALFASAPLPISADENVSVAYCQALMSSGIEDPGFEMDADLSRGNNNHFSTMFKLRWFDINNKNIPHANYTAATTTTTATTTSADERNTIDDTIKTKIPPQTSLNLPIWHPNQDSSMYIPSYNMWDGLCLECSLEWPLGILFPPETLQKYGALWQFMVRLKQVQCDVQKSWQLLMTAERQEMRRRRNTNNSTSNNSSSSSSSTPAFAMLKHSRSLHASIHRLQMRLIHFINTLSVYINVDVIESEAYTLRCRVDRAGDFSAADTAHREFINTLVMHTCLDIRQLMLAFEAVFGVARDFCSLIYQLEKNAITTSIALAKVHELIGTFALKQNLVFQLLQSNTMQSGPRGGAVRQFLMRLNYNEICGKEALEHIQLLRNA